MKFSMNKLSADQKYHLLIQTVMPRPIAWVLTKNENKSFNLSPFSYFSVICNDPPLITLSIGHKKDGQKKDTWRNIERDHEFVVNIPSSWHADLIMESSYEYKTEDSEVSALGLKTKKSFSKPKLPRLEMTGAALHCRLYEKIRIIGRSQQAFIIGEVTEVHINDSIVKKDQGRIHVNSKELNPLGRLGGNEFLRFGEVMTIARPDIPKVGSKK